MKNNNLRSRAYGALREKLISCEYAPGTMLNETQLCDELGISRTPVREALTTIAHEGFVKILPKKGIYVTDITLNDVVQIFQTRLAVEPVTLRMAAPSIPKEELLEYRGKLLDTEPDIREGFKLDTAMHLFIIKYCGSKYLIDMMYRLFDENTRVVIATKQNRAKIHDARKEHLEIINLLLKEEYDKAGHAMATHVQTCRKAALDFFYNPSAYPLLPAE